jgi:uncharacterized protein YdeI (YjbR/CyaY-like superfamily)
MEPMAKKDPRIDAYIAKAAPFARPILKHLRKMVHTGCPDVQETIKWGLPHFEHHGIMCGMAAFQNHCAFGFWKADLIFDGDERARRDAMGHFGRITELSDLPDEKTLIGHVQKAAKLNEARVKAPDRPKAKKKPLKMPDYFAAALKKNVKARKTFQNFSPSKQRDYIEWLSEAKRDETRQQRLKMSILWLAQGKPRNWKYMPEWK